MKNVINFLLKNKERGAAIDLAEFVETVHNLATRVAMLSGGQLGLETILEHHGLMTPEILQEIAPKMQAKLNPQEAPNEAATSTEDGSGVGEPGRGDVPA